MSESAEAPDEGFVQKAINNRWVWLSLTVVLLATAALVVFGSVQQSSRLQEQIEQAQQEYTANQELVSRATEVESATTACVEMVAGRIQQLEALKGHLAVIGTEYRNMYHAGIGNVNVDSYVDALNNFASITGVLDGQDLEACDAK